VPRNQARRKKHMVSFVQTFTQVIVDRADVQLGNPSYEISLERYDMTWRCRKKYFWAKESKDFTTGNPVLD